MWPSLIAVWIFLPQKMKNISPGYWTEDILVHQSELIMMVAESELIMMVTNTGGVTEVGQSGYLLKEKSIGCGDVKHERKGVVKIWGSESGKM